MAALGPPEDEEPLLKTLGELANGSGATLWIVHVLEPTLERRGDAGTSFDRLDLAEHALMRGIERARLESQDVRPLILTGAVESELPAAASMMEVDLVVLGCEPGRPPLDLLSRIGVRCPYCRILVVPREGALKS